MIPSMSATPLIPKNGAVSIGSLVADFASFDIEASQSVEAVTPYAPGTCAKNVGSGTPDFTIHVGAFALARARAPPPACPPSPPPARLAPLPSTPASPSPAPASSATC